MSHETDLLAFLHEAADLRVKGLSEQANQQQNFIEVNRALHDFWESVTDEAIRAALLEYEALKNDYIAQIMPCLYEAGARDVLTLYGLLSRQILAQG